MSLCGGDGAGGDLREVTHVAVLQPGGEAAFADPSDPVRAGVAGQQDQRTLAVGVVEFPFQGREDAGQHIPQPVDHPHPVGDQIGAVPGQQRQVADQVGDRVDDGQIGTDSGGFGDDVGVLSVDLTLAGERRAHRGNHPAGGIAHRLLGLGEQGQQQRRGGVDDVRRPVHLLGLRPHFRDHCG